MSASIRRPYGEPWPTHCWCGAPVQPTPGALGHRCRQCPKHCALDAYLRGDTDAANDGPPTGADPVDVVALRDILDMMDEVNFEDSDQRARYLLSSDWIRQRGAEAAERAKQVLAGIEARRAGAAWIAQEEDDRRRDRFTRGDR